MDNKNIYEIFNDIDFSNNEFEEIQLTDIEIKSLKKNVRKGIIIDKNENNYKKIISVAIICLIIICFGISPWGRSVIAEIKEKLIFTPTHGLIDGNINKELYVLKEPRMVNINGKDILVKSIDSRDKDGYLSISFSGVPFDEIQNIKDNVSVRTYDNKYIPISNDGGGGYGNEGSTGLWMLNVLFKQNDNLVTEFDLCYKGESIGSFLLDKVEIKDEYDEIGGNTSDKGIIIGATSYYELGKRYFKIWSNIENIDTDDYTLRMQNVNDIEVRDSDGKRLEIKGANDGTGRTYELVSDYKGNLNITIKKIEVEYELKNADDYKFKIPKDGESIKLNKEINYESIGEKIIATSVENIDDRMVINLKFERNEEKDRVIKMVSQTSRTGGSMGDRELLVGSIDIDNRRLSAFEKLTGTVKVNLNRIFIIQDGNWNFEIK